MPVNFHCAKCQHPLRISRQRIGKRIPCPQCGHEMFLQLVVQDWPHSKSKHPQSAPALIREELDEQVPSDDEIVQLFAEGPGKHSEPAKPPAVWEPPPARPGLAAFEVAPDEDAAAAALLLMREGHARNAVLPVTDDESISPPPPRISRRTLCFSLGGMVLLLAYWAFDWGEESVTAAPVSGQVTLNGKPLARATVLFVPVMAAEEATNRPRARGNTDASGRYTLTLVVPGRKIRGAKAGVYKVRINPDVRPEEDEPLPERYRLSNTKLEITVPESGTKSADFALTSP